MMSQTQVRLQCRHQDLKRQQQSRERVARLYNQWDEICRRQRDAHRRNQVLLRDFRRVERDLSILAAKTESFRRKRDDYKKFLSLSPPLDFETSHGSASPCGDRSPSGNLRGPIPTMYDGIVGHWQRPVSFEAHTWRNHFHQASVANGYSVGPNAPLGLKGHSFNPRVPPSYWSCMCPHWNGLSGGSLPDDLRVPCSTPWKEPLESPPWKTKHIMTDSTFPGDTTTTSNQWGTGVAQYPWTSFDGVKGTSEVGHLDAGTTENRVSSQKIPGAPHLCRCSANRSWTEKDIDSPKQRMMESGAVYPQGTGAESKHEGLEKTPVRLQATLSKCRQQSPYSFLQSDCESCDTGQLPPYPQHLGTHRHRTLLTPTAKVMQSTQTNHQGDENCMTATSPEGETSQKDSLAHKLGKEEFHHSESNLETRGYGMSFNLKTKCVDCEGDGVPAPCHQGKKEERSHPEEKSEGMLEIYEGCRQQEKKKSPREEDSKSEVVGWGLKEEQVSSCHQEEDESEVSMGTSVGWKQKAQEVRSSWQEENNSEMSGGVSIGCQKVAGKADTCIVSKGHLMVTKADSYPSNGPSQSESDAESDLPKEEQIGMESEGEDPMSDGGLDVTEERKWRDSVVCERGSSAGDKNVMHKGRKEEENGMTVVGFMEQEVEISEESEDDVEEESGNIENVKRTNEKEREANGETSENEMKEETEVKTGMVVEDEQNETDEGETERSSEREEGETDVEQKEETEGESSDESCLIVIVREKEEGEKMTNKGEKREMGIKQEEEEETESSGGGEGTSGENNEEGERTIDSIDADRDGRQGRQVRQEKGKDYEAQMDEGKSETGERKNGEVGSGQKKAIIEEQEEEEWADEEAEEGSGEETSGSGDQEDEDKIDVDSEENDNTDFWGNKEHSDDGGSGFQMEGEEEEVRRSQSDAEDTQIQADVEHTRREAKPPHCHKETVAAVCSQEAAGQDPAGVEQTETETQRPLWLCCLTTCPVPKFCNKREQHRPQRRHSDDCLMDTLQMSPIESGSMLPPQGALSAHVSRAADTESIPEPRCADSGEETSRGGNTPENQRWSDSEDNVHSFYD
ncbi:hypothetical protein FKM82_021950 [Ascaphus truei]